MAFGSKSHRRGPEILIVPLIDILLVLLIFLLTTTTFRQFPSVEISLPKSTSGEPAEPPEVVIISVTTSPPGIFLNRQMVSLDDLRFEFEAIAKADPETRLALNADKQAPFGVIMSIWQSARNAGLTKIQALTQEGVVSPGQAPPAAAP